MRVQLATALLLSALLQCSPGAWAEEREALTDPGDPPWALYDELLAKYVEPGIKHDLPVNLVNYTALKDDPQFELLVEMVQGFPIESLGSREDQIAYYVNAYNILTIKVIIDHWPVDSIRDIGNWLSNAWDIPVLVIDGEDKSLDDIEHKILRPLGEPRIHFALNCASVSCPDLRREAYRGGSLGDQLEEQTTAFLSQTDKGLTVDGDRLRLSRIFDWYEDDFDDLGGFIGHYRQDVSYRRIKTDVPYDWNLNGY